MVKRAIKFFGISEFLILASYFISFEFFINLQVAFLSSFFIIMGSMFAYKKMIRQQLASENIEEKRDLLDTIEDPYELYEEDTVNETPAEELDLKTIVKEEKAKIKTLSLKSIKHGSRGSVSFFRLVPYVFLILGFIALKNNEVLNISVYLPSLLAGIVAGYMSAKEIFA